MVKVTINNDESAEMLKGDLAFGAVVRWGESKDEVWAFITGEGNSESRLLDAVAISAARIISGAMPEKKSGVLASKFVYRFSKAMYALEQNRERDKFLGE